MIIIDIEIKERSRIKDFSHKLHNRIEDLLFNLIMKLPDKMISPSLMEWLDRYTTKRINQLNQQNVKNTWKNLYLQKAVDEISKNQ